MTIVFNGVSINEGITLSPPLTIVTANLVLHLDAGNLASYSGSGNTWVSLVGSYSGSMGTGVTYSTANSGIMTFSGATTAFVNMYGTANGLVSSATNNFSVEAWYRSTNKQPEIMATGVGSNGFDFGWFSTTGTAWKVTKYGIIDLSTGTIPQDNNWHQVVLTYSSTTGTRVYVDGSLSGSIANNNNLAGGTSFSIGKGESTSYMHNGSIGIFRWYTKVLSPGEVVQNFNANKSRYRI
jgi:hypothetical protein